MAQMAGGKEELVVMPENNLTNTTNLDAFLETVIDGWNTEFILIGLKSGGHTSNCLLGCFSKYVFLKHQGGFAQIWRGNSNGNFQNNVSRNDWGIRIVPGSIYRVIRNPFDIVFSE